MEVMDGERWPFRQELRVIPGIGAWWLPFMVLLAGWIVLVIVGAVGQLARGNPAGLFALLTVPPMVPSRWLRRYPLTVVARRICYLIAVPVVLLGMYAAVDSGTDLTPRWQWAGMAAWIVGTRVLGELCSRSRALDDRLPLAAVYWYSQFGRPGRFAALLAPLRTMPGAKLVHVGETDAVVVCGRRVAVVSARQCGLADAVTALSRRVRRAQVRGFVLDAAAESVVGVLGAWLAAEAGTVDRRVLARVLPAR